MSHEWETYDIDGIRADGFAYDACWSLQSPAWTEAFGPGLTRVMVSAPMRMDFSIYIVYGWDFEGCPMMYLTLSPNELNILLTQFSHAWVHEIKNRTLWENS